MEYLADFFTLYGPSLLLILFAVALIAGFIDSIAGGGGLITIPILLTVPGMTPVEALATNKLQAVGGSFSASLYFIRKKIVDLNRCKTLIATTFCGAVFGASLIQFISAQVLQLLLPVMIFIIGFYFLFSPKLGQETRPAKIGYFTMGAFTGLIGFYDGFFGPATGSFFALAFVTLMGFNLVNATAHAKVMNFTSNFASLLFFSLTGNILWPLGIIMLVGQIIGANIGARLVISKGQKIIRPMLVIVSFAISGKLLYSNYVQFMQ
ncbi:TSUP family transporter [Thorsellia kenyensis]|uniref:Probable membrane transporter protein n=1 Tax=Thorsellia kenyensis TaxID=1549888 RepID=A0ABV6C9Z9_9GAMM